MENHLKYIYMSWGLHRLSPEAATGSKAHLFSWLESAQEPFSLNCKNWRQMVRSEFLSSITSTAGIFPRHVLQCSLDVVYLHTSERLPGLPLQLHGREMTAIPCHFFHSSAECTLDLIPLVDIGDLNDAFSSPATNHPYPNFALLSVSLTYLQASVLLGLGGVLTEVPCSQSPFVVGKTVFGQIFVLDGLKDSRKSHTKRYKRLFIPCLCLQPHVWGCCMSRVSAGLLIKGTTHNSEWKHLDSKQCLLWPVRSTVIIKVCFSC